MIFVRALINPFSRPGRIVFDRRSHYHLIMSARPTAEILEVLRRPALLSLFRTLPGRDLLTVLDIVGEAETVEIATARLTVTSRDPKDDHVLATAVAGQVAVVVSEDKDLLVLDPYDGIRIIDALGFLRVLEAETETNGRDGG